MTDPAAPTTERARWKRRITQLKRELHALAIATRDPRTPWYARAVAACVVAYAISPIDLIPDPIPVLGLLDDAILLPLGIMLAIRLIPDDVLTDARTRVDNAPISRHGRVAATIVICTWLALAATATLLMYRLAT